MNRFIIMLVGFGAMTIAALGLAGTASAASADVTVNGLTTEGFSVQLTTSPTTNLTACTVTNVKKDPIAGSNPTAYVDITCPDGC